MGGAYAHLVKHLMRLDISFHMQLQNTFSSVVPCRTLTEVHGRLCICTQASSVGGTHAPWTAGLHNQASWSKSYVTLLDASLRTMHAGTNKNTTDLTRAHTKSQNSRSFSRRDSTTIDILECRGKLPVSCSAFRKRKRIRIVHACWEEVFFVLQIRFCADPQTMRTD